MPKGGNNEDRQMRRHRMDGVTIFLLQDHKNKGLSELCSPRKERESTNLLKTTQEPELYSTVLLCSILSIPIPKILIHKSFTYTPSAQGGKGATYILTSSPPSPNYKTDDVMKPPASALNPCQKYAAGNQGPGFTASRWGGWKCHLCI